MAAKKTKDLALVYGATEDETGLKVLRHRAATGTIDAGVVHPLKQGQNITGEVVRLTPHADVPLVYEVDVEVEANPATLPSRSAGPAQVASDMYRNGWDTIWGRPRRRISAPN